MRTFFILTCLIIYGASFFVDVRPLGFTDSSPLFTHYSYMFTHLGFGHLLINLIGIFGFSTAVRRYDVSSTAFLAAMLCAVAASMGTGMDLPTVGASGVSYALMGIYTAYNFKYTWLASVIVIISIMLFAGQYNHANTSLHLLAFIYGFIIYAIKNLWTKRHANKRLSASV